VGQPAAGQICPSRVNGAIALLDVDNFPLLIDYESRTIRHSDLGDQNTIGHSHLAFGEIAEQGEGGVHFGGELLLGLGIVGTNSKNLCFVAFKFSDTSLVCQHFLGSTTGESGWEEGYHHIRFTAEIG